AVLRRRGPRWLSQAAGRLPPPAVRQASAGRWSVAERLPPAAGLRPPDAEPLRPRWKIREMRGQSAPTVQQTTHASAPPRRSARRQCAAEKKKPPADSISRRLQECQPRGDSVGLSGNGGERRIAMVGDDTQEVAVGGKPIRSEDFHLRHAEQLEVVVRLDG